MELMSILILLITAAFLSVLLRRSQPEAALGIGLIAGIVVLWAALERVVPLIESVRSMLEGAELPSIYVGILFRALGVCLLTQLAADTCRDAGETALASKAEFVGKILLMVLSMPLFEEIIRLAQSLMQGEL